MNKTLVAVIASYLILGSVAAVAKDHKGSKRFFTREVEGQIYRIKLEDRTAWIGGFEYYLGEPRFSNTPDIFLLNGDEVVYEMLQVGMRVKVRYADLGHIRIAKVVRQVDQVPGWYVGKTYR